MHEFFSAGPGSRGTDVFFHLTIGETTIPLPCLSATSPLFTLHQNSPCKYVLHKSSRATDQEYTSFTILLLPAARSSIRNRSRNRDMLRTKRHAGKPRILTPILQHPERETRGQMKHDWREA